MMDKICGLFSDKGLVIIALTVLGITTLAVMGQTGENILTAIVAGLCGIAVGHNLDGSK